MLLASNVKVLNDILGTTSVCLAVDNSTENRAFVMLKSAGRTIDDIKHHVPSIWLIVVPPRAGSLVSIAISTVRRRMERCHLILRRNGIKLRRYTESVLNLIKFGTPTGLLIMLFLWRVAGNTNGVTCNFWNTR